MRSANAEKGVRPVADYKVFKPSFIASPLSFRWMTQSLTVYKTKVVFKSGIFSTKERTIPASRITDISVTKGCLGGMLGYGNLYIETAGSGAAEIVVPGIEKPDKVKDLILRVIEHQRGA